MKKALIPVARIEDKIQRLRSHNIMIDSDLAVRGRDKSPGAGGKEKQRSVPR